MKNNILLFIFWQSSIIIAMESKNPFQQKPESLKISCFLKIAQEFNRDISQDKISENNFHTKIKKTLTKMPQDLSREFIEFLKNNSMNTLEKWFPGLYMNVHGFDTTGDNALYLIQEPKHDTQYFLALLGIGKENKMMYQSFTPNFLPVDKALFSPDGKNIILQRNDCIQILRLDSNEDYLVNLPENCFLQEFIEGTENIEFSWNNKKYYLSADKLLQLAKADHAQMKHELQKFNFHKNCTKYEFLKNYPWYCNLAYNLIITQKNSEENALHLLNLEEKFIQELVEMTQIDPTKKYIISISYNNTISLWDIDHEICLQTIFYKFNYPIIKLIWKKRSKIYLVDEYHNIYMIQVNNLKLADTIEKIVAENKLENIDA